MDKSLASSEWSVRFSAMAIGMVLVLSSVVVTPPSAHAQDETAGPAAEPDALEAIYERFLEDDELQFSIPEAEPLEARDPPPQWLEATLRFFADVLRWLGPVLRVLFYVICAVGIIAIGWYVAQRFLGVGAPSSRREKLSDYEDSIAQPFRPDAAVARSLLEEADALAAQGRFAEAVHLLLFRSIEDIQTRREGGVPKSLTAREIEQLDSLPERARFGLSPIIAIVERSFFGGRNVDRDGWQSARSSYEDFAFGEVWT
ncbi:MAG: hypothetical protein AAGJ32_02255 [Pseudomonadota bacterium]